MGAFFYDLPPNETRSNAYGLVNGKLGWENRRYEAYLWGRNLLNKNYTVRGFYFGEPSVSDQTVAGLPVRVPRANMPQGTGTGALGSDTSTSTGAVGAGPGLPARTPGTGRVPGGGNAAANGGNTLPQRSPEQVRSRLAGFQRGTRRAEGQGGSGGQASRPGEGTER